MKEWSAKIGDTHWRLAIKNRRLYGKLVGDTSRELLPLTDVEIRKQSQAEEAADVLVRHSAAVVVEAKKRMVSTSIDQLVSSLGSRLRHLQTARDLIRCGDVDPRFDDQLSTAMRLCMEILETIETIPTE